MAYNKNNVLLRIIVASLFIVLFFSSGAIAQTTTVFGGLEVTDELCCEANLTCPGAALSGAVVRLLCTNISIIPGTAVAQTVTGTFNMSVRPPLLCISIGLLSSLLQCSLRATTANCSLVSDRQILTAPLQAVGGPISTPTGLVQRAVNGPFSRFLA